MDIRGIPRLLCSNQKTNGVIPAANYNGHPRVLTEHCPFEIGQSLPYPPAGFKVRHLIIERQPEHVSAQRLQRRQEREEERQEKNQLETKKKKKCKETGEQQQQQQQPLPWRYRGGSNCARVGDK